MKNHWKELNLPWRKTNSGRPELIDRIPRAKWITELKNASKEFSIIAAGPSSPSADEYRLQHPTIALNRAVLWFDPDYLMLSSDSLVLLPERFKKLIGSVSDRAIFLVHNFSGSSPGSERENNYRENVRALCEMPNDIYSFLAVGSRNWIRSVGLSEYLCNRFRQGTFYSYRTILCSAIEAARFLGAKRVHLFGIDGGARKTIYKNDTIIPPDQELIKFSESVFSQMRKSFAFAFNNIWSGRIELVNNTTGSLFFAVR